MIPRPPETAAADPPAPSDEALAEQAAGDDRRAFERLVRRWQDRLLRFLVARTPRESDAKDALQEAFVATWRYRASYRPGARYGTWLYRIALREAGRLDRANRRAERPWDAGPAHGDGPGESTAVWGQARILLSDSAFTVLWLRYHEDWTVKEIGQCLRRPAAWVRLSLHRSRRRLAAHLAEPP